MKDRKSCCLCFLLCALLILAAACGSATENPAPGADTEPQYNAQTAEQAVFIMPDGLPAMGALSLMNGETPAGYDWQYQVMSTPDLLAGELLSGKAQAAIVPANLAAQLYNKKAGYVLTAIGGLGSQYILATDPDVKSWTDLKGKKIMAYGKGLVPDAMMRQALKTSGINADSDVTVEYLGAVSEVAATYNAGKSNIVLLTEPVLSAVLAKVQGDYTLLNVQEACGDFVQTALVVSESLSEEGIKNITEAYTESVAYTNDPANLDSLKAMAKERNISGVAALSAAGLERANLLGRTIDQDAAMILDSFWQTLLANAPDTIGGAAPDAAFYVNVAE